MKKSEIIVHIGMHKTGTTSIQRTLDKHLNDPKYNYVKLANPNHSRQIFTLFEEKNHPSIHNIKEEKIVETNKQTKYMLIENFQKHPNKIHVISGESIRGMSVGALENLKSFLDQYFHKITIVAYIRPPKSYMESALQQIIKDGTSHFDIERTYPNYRKFQQFFNIFGQENVQLWKFDPKGFPRGNVVLDFCQRLGITIELKNIINDNESISKEALSLLYIYRKYGPGYGDTAEAGKENQQLIKALSRIKGPKVRFGPKLIKPILNKHKHDITWMEHVLGTSLSEQIILSKDNIREEKDLLSVSDKSLEKLKELIADDNVTAHVQTDTIEKIADLVQVLRTHV